MAAAVIAFQVAGGLVGLLLVGYGDGFVRLWMGAALASGPGLLAGILWHRSDPLRRKSTSAGYLVYLGVLAILIVGGAIFMVGPHFREQARLLEKVKTIPAGSVRRVLVYEDRRATRAVVIEDEAALAGFVAALRDAKDYYPNHPVVLRSWHVVADGLEFEMRCSCERGRPGEVTGYFLVGSRCYGNFRSRGLRKWFDEHIRARAPEEVTR